MQVGVGLRKYEEMKAIAVGYFQCAALYDQLSSNRPSSHDCSLLVIFSWFMRSCILLRQENKGSVIQLKAFNFFIQIELGESLGLISVMLSLRY